MFRCQPLSQSDSTVLPIHDKRRGRFLRLGLDLRLIGLDRCGSRNSLPFKPKMGGKVLRPRRGNKNQQVAVMASPPVETPSETSPPFAATSIPHAGLRAKRKRHSARSAAHEGHSVASETFSKSKINESVTTCEGSEALSTTAKLARHEQHPTSIDPSEKSTDECEQKHKSKFPPVLTSLAIDDIFPEDAICNQDFFETSPERRTLISELAEIREDWNLDLWAVLQVCSIQRLEVLVLDVKVASPDDKHSILDWLEDTARNMMQACRSINWKHMDVDDESLVREAKSRRLGRWLRKELEVTWYMPEDLKVMRIILRKLIFERETSCAGEGGRRHDFWFGLITFWGYDWCRTAHELLGAPDPYNYGQPGKEDASNIQLVTTSHSGPDPDFSKSMLKPIRMHSDHMMRQESISAHWGGLLPADFPEDGVPESLRDEDCNISISTYIICAEDSTITKLPSYDLVKIRMVVMATAYLVERYSEWP